MEGKVIYLTNVDRRFFYDAQSLQRIEKRGACSGGI